MLVRAIVPAGFMLAEAQGAEGRYLTVTICDGHMAPQVVDLDTGKLVDSSKPNPAGKTDKPDKSAAPPCMFAAAAPLAPPVYAIAPAVFVDAHRIVFVVRSDLRPGLGIAAPPPPATGPPILI
jgi:hypothetical protein